ncbi:MAG: putative bifunctional diguanylate cyclase/phosphodiesterase [Burkholderiaceae bacterium]
MPTFDAAMTWGLALLAIAAAFGAWQYRRSDADKGSDSLYRLATDTSDEAFLVLNPVYSGGKISDWKITDCSQGAAKMWGMEKDAMLSILASSLYSSGEFRNVCDIYAWALERGEHEDEYQEDFAALRPSLRLRRRIAACNGKLAVSLKESSPAEAEIEMERLANEDAVTTLPNRNWLIDFLPGQLQDTKRRVVLFLIDLDDFKNVNDALGHSAGDLLLRVTAMRLKSVVRPGDWIARLGGDEFAIVLPGAQPGELRKTAELINEILCFPLELVSGKKSMTSSIGVSVFPDDALDMETLLKNAEIAMYAAKANGKAGYCFYEPDLSDALKDRLALEQDLSDAIDRDQFVLFFEPKIHVQSGRLCGMEALVRWQHPERGLVPPQEFIALAESTGLIVELGDHVITKAFEQLAEWRQAGLPVVPVSINISAQQLNNGSLAKRFGDALEQYPVEPELIQVELTESVMLGEKPAVVSELAKIRAFGVRMLLDDFGTGYSSLSQLQRLKMDTLKIDQAFLHQIDRSEEGKIFVSAIISMAHALGLTVVAEGVETESQLTILRSLGCDEAQGYLFARPMSAEAAGRFLTRSACVAVNELSFE